MSNPSTNLEVLLQTACRRALSLGVSFTNQLRLYRSILALAREVRLRFGAATPESAALLAQVCERAAECGLDPELPLPDAIPMLRLTVSLSRAARQAEGTETAQPRSSDRRVAQHEAPAEPAQEGPAAENITDYPMQSAPEAPDNNRRTAWQLDRTPERPIAKVRETNRRGTEERYEAAWPRAA